MSIPSDQRVMGACRSAGPNDEDKQMDVADPLAEQKIHFITTMMGSAISRSQICDNFVNFYHVSKRQAYRYFNSALWLLRDNQKKKMPDHIAMVLHRLEDIERAARASGDLRAALAAEVKRAEYLGIDNKTFQSLGMGADAIGPEEEKEEKIQVHFVFAAKDRDKIAMEYQKKK